MGALIERIELAWTSGDHFFAWTSKHTRVGSDPPSNATTSSAM